MLKLHSLAANFMRDGKKVDWVEIRRMVDRTKPPYAEYTDALAAFVSTRSGGLDPTFLKYMAAFHNLCCNPSVRGRLPPALYKALADFPHHFLAIAIWETAYLCPIEHIVHRQCSWIKAAEVSVLGKPGSPAAALAAEAEELLKSVRGTLASTGLGQEIHTDNELVKVFVLLDVAVAKVVLARPPTPATAARPFDEPACFAHVPQYFSSLLKRAFPNADTDLILELAACFPAPVAPASAKAASAKAAAAVATLELYTVSASGEMLHGRALLRQRGMDEGSVVQETASAKHFKIKAVTEAPAGTADDATAATVCLQGLGLAKGEERCVDVSRFLEAFAFGAERDVVEHQPGWPEKRVASLPEVRRLWAKGLVVAGLGSLMQLACSRIDPANLVTIFAKPSRKVVASCPVAPNMLVLLPESGSVKESDRRAEAKCGFDQHGTLEVVLLERAADSDTYEPAFSDVVFSLQPATSEKALAPLWFVATCSDEASANMTWGWVKLHNMCAVESGGEVELPPPPRKRLHKGEMPTCRDAVAEHQLWFPALTNTRALAAGEELKCYKPAGSPSARAGPKPITATMLSKQLTS